MMLAAATSGMLVLGLDLGLALRTVNNGLGLIDQGLGLVILGLGLSHRESDFACTRFTFLF